MMDSNGARRGLPARAIRFAATCAFTATLLATSVAQAERVFFDPRSGATVNLESGRASTAEARPFEERLSTSSEGLSSYPGVTAKGGVVVPFDGRFTSLVTVTRPADGSVEVECSTTHLQIEADGTGMCLAEEGR